MYFGLDKEKEFTEFINNTTINEDEALMVYSGDQSYEKFLKYYDVLFNSGITFFGGVFPGVIYNNNIYHEGIIVKKVTLANKPYVIKEISNIKNYTLPQSIVNSNTEEKHSAFLFIDGFAKNIESMLISLYNKTANQYSFFGGGTGTLGKEKVPSVFSNEGIFSDALVLAITNKKANITVKHGWEKIAGPLLATKTTKNTIEELNWESAFNVYKKSILVHSGKNLNSENFFEIAKNYPFGMFREFYEDIIRDPFQLDENGNITCVGAVPENSVINIMHGEKDALIKAAEKVAELQVTDNTPDEFYIFDCISRALFLENDIKDELNVVLSTLNEKELFGAFSIGEIASYGHGLPVFFNKTIVMNGSYESA